MKTKIILLYSIALIANIVYTGKTKKSIKQTPKDAPGTHCNTQAVQSSGLIGVSYKKSLDSLTITVHFNDSLKIIEEIQDETNSDLRIIVIPQNNQNQKVEINASSHHVSITQGAYQSKECEKKESGEHFQRYSASSASSSLQTSQSITTLPSEIIQIDTLKITASEDQQIINFTFNIAKIKKNETKKKDNSSAKEESLLEEILNELK